MKHILWIAIFALIFALALPGCTTPTVTRASDGSVQVTISAARVANCKANGGCGLYSRNELLELVRVATEAARQTCPNKEKVLL